MNLVVSELDLVPKQYTPFLSLVVPTYNESANIENVVRCITEILDQLLPHSYELIIVDDDSPDHTWQQAEAMQANYPYLRVIRRIEERGLATAVIRGWQAAHGKVLGVIDGDLQHPPQVLGELLKAVQEEADLAVASRYIQGGGVGTWNKVRQFLSGGAVRLALFFLPEVSSRVSDPMSGYFLVKREAIAGRTLAPIGYKILLEVIGRGQIKRVAEVGYVFNTRQEGDSKVTWRQYAEFVQHLIRLRFATGNSPVGTLGRFLRFGTVGFSGVFVDFFILLLMHKVFRLDVSISKAIAVEIAIFNNFIWNDLWTFQDASRQFKGWKHRLIRFLRFNLACAFGAALGIAIVTVLKNLGINLLISNLVAITISTAWNYLINLKFNWKTK